MNDIIDLDLDSCGVDLAEYAFDPTDADPRELFRPEPMRIVIEGQLSTLRNTVLEAIRRWNAADPQHPILYQSAGALVQLVRDAEGGAKISKVGDKGLLATLAEVGHWVRVKEQKNGDVIVTDARPDKTVIEALLGMHEWPGIPTLQGVTWGPTFASDGSLHAEPGYSEKTQSFMAGRVKIGDTRPTDANIARAKSLILGDLLEGFPFADTASQAHAVALLLLPFVRNLIDGPTPLHIVSSTTAGTGKGLLVGATMIPAMGRKPAAKSGDRSREEWTKTLTSMLATGTPVAFFDNLTGTISHDALASASTEPFYSDRVFSRNDQEITVPVRCTWILTGNNITGNEDISRRSVLIRLDANSPEAAQRTGFKHPHLLSWATAHRGDLATAAVTLINAWLAKGRPTWSGRTMGSFEAWAETMGGILHTVGIDGFLQTSEAVAAGFTTQRTNLIAEFVRAWAEEHKDGDVGVDTLFQLAGDSDDPEAIGYHNLLGDLLGAGNERSRRTKLGNVLQELRDKVFRVTHTEGDADPLAGALGAPSATGTWKVRFVKRDRTKKAVFKLQRIDAPSLPKAAEPRNPEFEGSAVFTSLSAEPRNLEPYADAKEDELDHHSHVNDSRKVPRGSAVPRFTLVEAAEPSDQGSAVKSYVGKFLENGDIERIVELANQAGMQLGHDYRFDRFGKGHALIILR